MARVAARTKVCAKGGKAKSQIPEEGVSKATKDVLDVTDSFGHLHIKFAALAVSVNKALHQLVESSG